MVRDYTAVKEQGGCFSCSQVYRSGVSYEVACDTVTQLPLSSLARRKKSMSKTCVCLRP